MNEKVPNEFNLYGTDIATKTGFESVSAIVESGFNLMSLGPERPR